MTKDVSALLREAAAHNDSGDLKGALCKVFEATGALAQAMEEKDRVSKKLCYSQPPRLATPSVYPDLTVLDAYEQVTRTASCMEIRA